MDSYKLLETVLRTTLYIFVKPILKMKIDSALRYLACKKLITVEDTVECSATTTELRNELCSAVVEYSYFLLCALCTFIYKTFIATGALQQN